MNENNFDMPGLIRGWSNICRFLGCSLSTARRRKKDGLPIRYEPNSSIPLMISWEYYQWLIIFTDLKNKRKSEQAK